MNQQTINNKNLFAVIINFFTENSWTFEQIEPDSILQIVFQGKNGIWNCYAQLKEIPQQFIFYSVCPVTVPEYKRLAISEFIARVNYGLTIGNFELDFRDGEIRYKTSIDIEDNRLSFTGINNLVYTNIMMMDKYLPGIISVIKTDISPESAINQIEQNRDISQISNEVEQLEVNIPTNKQEELVFNLSSQTDLQPQQAIIEKEPHILTILTPEEIGQFHQALQVMPHYQRKKSEAIMEKLQIGLITRLGDLGEEIFTQASNFFREVKIEVKNIKLIQRYSGIAGQTKLLLQNLSNGSNEHGEMLTPITNAVEKVSNLFWSINTRLQELPIDKLEGEKEVELLIEIEEFRFQLSSIEKLIENTGN